MRDENGKRKEQKQVLTMTVAEAHSLFIGENPTIVVGKSKFAEFIKNAPQHLWLHLPRQHSTFMEEIHRKLLENFPPYGEEFVKSCACDTTNKKFMTSNCVLCKTKFQKTYLGKIEEKNLRVTGTWYRWEKGKHGQTEKNKKKGTFENLLLTLQNLLTKFLLHYFINKLQTEA